MDGWLGFNTAAVLMLRA